MVENPQVTVFGQIPTRFGIISLSAACLAWLCWPLIIEIGFLVSFLEMPLVLIAFVSGLLGLGTGVYYKNVLAIVTSILGLVLIGCGVAFIAHALANF